MTKTEIEWADEVWNPTSGCTKVSQGCKYCYAEQFAKRFWKDRKFSDVLMHPERLDDPYHWKKPRIVFVDSMSDLFHPDIPMDYISAVFNRMEVYDRHIYMVLTKRPERMLEFIEEYKPPSLPNVWLGVSVEDQENLIKRVPLLMQAHGFVTFVSFEPLLGEIDFSPLIKITNYDGPAEYFKPFDMAIVGGESGVNARPMHPNWVRGIRDYFVIRGISFFFKQWGEWRPYNSPFGWKRCYDFPDGEVMIRVGKKRAGRILDGRIWNEYPE